MSVRGGKDTGDEIAVATSAVKVLAGQKASGSPEGLPHKSPVTRLKNIYKAIYANDLGGKVKVRRERFFGSWYLKMWSQFWAD